MKGFFPLKYVVLDINILYMSVSMLKRSLIKFYTYEVSKWVPPRIRPATDFIARSDKSISINVETTSVTNLAVRERKRKKQSTKENLSSAQKG